MPESWKTLSDPYGMDNSISLSFADELEKSLIGYLNQNGTPYQLQNDLHYTDGISYADIREYDFDTDGENEVIFALEVSKPEFWATYLLIAKCNQNQYQFVEKMDNFGNLVHAARILVIKDLNNDGSSEIVWKTTWAGSDLMPFINIMSWNETTENFEDIFTPNGVPLGDVKITIGDTDNNGIDEIMLYGRLNHRGDLKAMVTYTYAWDGQSYTKIKEEITP
jgi:hypothetical protein